MKLLLAVLGSLICLSAASPRTLVILENILTKETHSSFLADLKSKNTEVVFKYATDSALTIKKYDERLYDNIVILAPSVTAFGNGIAAADFLQFVDDGGNLLVTGSSEIGDPIKEIAADCGIEFDDEGTSVIDHMNYDVSDAGQHTLIVADQFSPHSIISGADPKPVLFNGIGMAADPENPLVIDILHAASTAYSHAIDKDILEYPLAIGTKILLVAGMQARNNARVVFIGSQDMLSDAFYNAKVKSAVSTEAEASSGNKDFVSNVMSWVFKENGNLRFSGVSHNQVGFAPSDTGYRITDDVEFSIIIEEMRSGEWVAFQGGDVQLEFVRIDPFVRTGLTPDAAGNFKVQFKIPDVYGVFQFKVDYDRVGYTHLYSATQVSVRPFRHTEYERFIPSAYPYYASAFSMMGGLFVFSLVFLYHKDEVVKDKDQ